MLFGNVAPSEPTIRAMSPRLLAHLGDAVFHLYEREREIVLSSSASQMHKRASKRASAVGQADLLTLIAESLTEQEADIVRRARNMKPLRQRNATQDTYRRATGFEALLGYLYLTDKVRLGELLDLTLPASQPPGEIL